MVTIITLSMLLGEVQLGNTTYVARASETTEITVESTTEITRESTTEGNCETEAPAPAVTEEITTEAVESITGTMEESTQLNGAQTISDETENVVTDMTVSENLTLTSDMTVGNLQVNKGKTLDLNGYVLTVEGSTIIQGNVMFHKGELICYGDTNISSEASVTMDNANDYMIVYGKLTYYGESTLTAGVIEAKGDFVANNSFVATDMHKVIFSGDNEQIVSVSDGGSFNEVEIRNYTSGGITIQYSFNYAKLTDNNCVLNYAKLDGERGYTLTEDTEIDGSYYLVSDELNLNGCTMTINGDLIQSGGTINVNGGRLIVHGDYRLQSRTLEDNNVAVYGQSTGTLIMVSEGDWVHIDGDFISETSVNHTGKLTNGVMEITGDINVSKTYSRYAFVSSDNHTVILSGEEKQNIAIEMISVSSCDAGSHIGNIIIRNTSEEGINLGSKLYVSGVVDVQEGIVEGVLVISDNTSFSHSEYVGDVHIYGGDTVLTQDMCITGEVILEGTASLNYNLTVNGNVTGYYSTLTLGGKSLAISGNSIGVEYTMNNSNDYVSVGGDLELSNPKLLSKGTAEVKGDLRISGYDSIGSEHRFLLSGDKLQTISTTAKLGILELQNYSEEGVYSDKPISKGELIRNGCKLTYGSLAGEFGWTLSGDYTYEGDLILIDDQLNLNGHTLTVRGDYIQISGITNINGGKLVVEGDYRMQGIQGDIADGNFTNSTGAIQMTSTDSIVVYGDMYYYSSNKINSGTVELKGDFSSGYFSAGDECRFIFSGDEKQTIGVDSSVLCVFSYLEFDNTSSEGIHIVNNLQVTKHIDDNESAVHGEIKAYKAITFGDDKFQGDLYLSVSRYEIPNLHILGNLTNTGTIKVNSGRTLKIDGNLNNKGNLYAVGDVVVGGDCKLETSGVINVTEGSMEVMGDLSFVSNTSGAFQMSGEKAYVLVTGDVTSTTGCKNISLRKGTLEVKGNIDMGSQVVGDNQHTLLLSGDALQTVKVTDDTSWGTIEIKNYSEEGVYAEKVLSKNLLVRNGCRLRYGNCQGEFGWTLSGDRTWEGDLIIIDDTMDLNGYTLTVTGDLIQQSGDIRINGGRLIVQGDYRMQTIITTEDGVEYDSGASRILMQEEQDYVIIYGDYIVGTKSSQQDCITAGAMEIKGNIHIDNQEQKHALYFDRGATLILSGEAKQSIVTLDTEAKLHLGSVRLDNTSGEKIATDGNLKIYGMVSTKDNTFDKPVYVVSETTYDGNLFNGDIIISENYVVPVGKTITINGNVNSSYIMDIYGSLIIGGNYQIDAGYIRMRDNSATLNVGGDFCYKSGLSFDSITAGTITISGNLTSSGGFCTTGTNKVVLDGKDKQDIAVSRRDSFALLEIQNISREGVCSENYIYLNQLIDPYNKLTIEAVPYENGITLTQDTTVPGDYYLGYGVMNLNGHKLTIEGDLIHAGGDIVISGGELNISGDYIQKVKYVENGTEIWSPASGRIVMDGKSDKVEVKGNLELYPCNDETYNQITGGNLYIGGDINVYGKAQSGNYIFKTLGSSKVYLNGDNQRISGGGCEFSSLYIETGESLCIDAGVRVTKTLSSECKDIAGMQCIAIDSFSVLDSDTYWGNISISKADTLDSSKDIRGTLNICEDIDLHGYEINCNNLNVYAEVNLNGGRINCIENLDVGYYGSLVMTDTNDYICVGGNVTFNSSLDHAQRLTAGTLELKGDFTDTYKMFRPSGTHKTVLDIKYKESGKEYIQYITFDYEESRFNTLVLKKDISKYVFSRDVDSMAVEVIYQIEDTKNLSPVTNLTITAVDMTSVTMEYEQEDNSGTIGYAIYRDGERIGSTGVHTYVDSGLDPDTAYTYEVYPINSQYEIGTQSARVEVTTLADTQAPTIPQNLSITGVTGSSITISWSAATDNRRIAGYEVHRDGVIIATLNNSDENTTYKDNQIGDEDNHTYTVVAYDEAGNKSQESGAVTGKVLMPVITAVEPADYSRMNNNSQKLCVYYKNMGCGDEYKVDIKYRAKGEEQWNTIEDSSIKTSTYNAQTYIASYDWDTRGLTELEYQVQYSIIDKDDNISSQIVNYYVDNVAPIMSDDLKVTSMSGVLKLEWSASVAHDSDRYNIYRREYDSGEEYKLIHTEYNQLVESYIDKAVEEGVIYEYAITAVDTSDNESEKTSGVKALVSPDEEAPSIASVSPEIGKINGISVMSITAKDNKELASISVLYRRQDSQEWIKLEEIETSGHTVSYRLDTKNLEDGVYYFNFVATDTSRNTSIEEYTRRYEVDNTGISKINITEVTSGSTFVQLKWDDVPEGDFAYFQIEQMMNGGYMSVGRVSNVLGYTVEGLNPNSTYRFRVVGYDTLGNKGEYSDTKTISTVTDTVAPVINAIYPTETHHRNSIVLSLKATDNYKIDYASFYYSTDGDSYTKIADVRNTGNVQKVHLQYTLDTANIPEGKLYIKYEVYDVAGNKNVLTESGEDIVNEYIIDRTAPSRPGNMMAASKEGYIALSWDKPTDTDIRCYKIYRADAEDGIFALIKDDLQNATYNDTDIEPGKSYIYRMVAVDKAGNVSEYSDLCTASALRDKSAPYIAGVSLVNGTVIGEDTDLTIIARDNSKLSHIEVDIMDNTEGIWINLAKKKASGSIYRATVELQLHNMPEGKYSYRIRAIDEAGNQSEYLNMVYVLDTTPAVAGIEANTGDLCIDISMELPEDKDFTHVDIYRREISEGGEAKSDYTKIYTGAKSEYKDKDIEPWQYYEYKLHSYDEVGNCYVSDAVSSYGTDNDTEAPVAILPDSVRVLAGMEVCLDGGESSDNVRIASYSWELSDGTTYTGRQMTHIFNQQGTYDVTLTVTDVAGNSSSTTSKVQVIGKDGAGSIIINVVDTAGKPVPYAYVYLNDSLNSEKSYKTDCHGKVTVSAKRGDYIAAAYKTGYIPKDIDVTVSEYEDLEYTITIPSGDIVVGDFSVHKMSLEEMVEAGVDFSAPENMHRFTFEVMLEFQEYPIPVEVVYVGDAYSGGNFEIESGGFGVKDEPLDLGGGDFAKTNPKVKLIKPKDLGADVDHPLIVTVRTIQTVSWLKDMYSVELGVLNTADAQYVIEDSYATISLPEGLSLATTHSGQSSTVDMGDIYGQERKSTTWIVKGDTPGDYEISADFTGNLMPFDCPVNAHFECGQTIGVSTYDGLTITVMPEASAYTGENYYIQFSVSNETGRPLYNFTTTFGPYTKPGLVDVTYVIQPGSDEKELYDSYKGSTQSIGELSELSQTPVLKGDEKLSIATLEPGQTIYGTYSCSFPGIADPTEFYYGLKESMVEVLEGNGLGVNVEVKPISGHISKRIIKGVARKSMFGDPVDVTTGAYLDEYEAISITGRDILSLDLYYSSLDAGISGELGYGWSHNYESFIREDMGMVHYYTSPSTCASFLNEDSLNGIKYGTFDGNTLKLSSDTGKDTLVYRSITTGMDGYVLLKNPDGTYTMTTPAGYVYEYGTDGKLTRMTIEEGRSVSISYAPDQMIVTEDATGNRLKLDYKDGKLISVTDNTGRTATFAYTGDYLTTITNPIGETVSYEYDLSGRLIKGKNTYGEAFVTNTYDEAGQVVKQLDDRGNEIGFRYKDSDTGRITECIAADGSVTTVESDLCGNITKIISPQGAVTTHEYDRLGNKVKSVDAYGNVYSYNYDQSGNILGYTSDLQDDISFTYDDKGNVIAISSDEGNLGTYNYDTSGNMIYATDGQVSCTYTYDGVGNLTSISRAGKGTTYYTYDEAGLNLSSAKRENGYTVYMDYDNRGNIIMTKDAVGAITRYEYDLMNRRIKTINPDGGEVSYTYDVYGNISSVIDPMGYRTTYAYDTGGRLSSTTYADGSVESFVYDEMGNLKVVMASDGRRVTYEYDGLGNVTKITYPDGTTEECTYDMLGQITSSTDILGHKSVYNYDTTGTLRSITSPDGQTLTAIYGADNKIEKVTDNQGKSSEYTYDSRGNVTSMTDTLGNTVTYEYSSWGELISETDAKGNKTTYTYDKAGQCTAITNPEGTTTYMVYDPCGRVSEAYVDREEEGRLSVRYTYDSMGRVSTYTDEMGNTTTYKYDLNGNLISVTDSEGVITSEYTYDCMGKVLQEKTASGIVVTYSYNKSDLVEKAVMTSPTGEKKAYTYTYDDIGRVLSVTDPSGSVSSQSYDAVGNITDIVYPEGGGISYTYDDYGRVTEEKLSIGTRSTYEYNADSLLSLYTNSRGQKTDYTYDALGRITSFSDQIGTVTYTYDGNGNVLKTTEKTKDGKTHAITRTYDCMNRVTSYTDYKGNTVKYGYDELGNLVSLTYPGGEIVRYSYDKVGLLTTVTDESGLVTSYTYDKMGRLYTTTKPDGSVETNTYDKQSRLTERTVVGKDGKLINKYTYTYDSWGNILTIGYESSLEGDASTTTFTSASMTYDSSNRMVTYNGEKIRYDDDGNMLYGPLDGVMTEFEYDCRNRLIRAGDTTYEYDAENVRSAVETPDYREEYVTDSVSELTRVLVITREYKTENKTDTEKYYYGNGLIYENSSEVGVLVYHYNHLGSTTAVTDKDGKLVYSYDYGTYGELIITTEYSTITPVIRFLYNGQLGVATDDNGLYYMRSRYYNPDIKRFINQDVLIGSITNSASLNRYSYVEGNPVSYTDPFGLSPFDFLNKFNPSVIAHTVMDVLGCMPGGAIFDIANAALYWIEDNEEEFWKSLIFAMPGMDLAGKATKWGAKLGGKGGKMLEQTLKAADFTGHLAAIQLSASDFGNGIAFMIDKYMVGEAEFSSATVLELVCLGGHGFQLKSFSGSFMNNVNVGKYDSLIPGMSNVNLDLDKLFSDGSMFYQMIHDNSGIVRPGAEVGFWNKGGTSTDFYVGPNGKALPSQYKDWIGTNMQDELLSQAKNPQLQNAIKQLYRGKSFIGDGGTADVIRFEKQTGILLGKNGGSHVQKGIDMASYIENKILTQNLSDTDRALATKLLDELNDALGR